MHILMITDIKQWAIGNLCNSIIKHNPHVRFSYISAHPRGVSEALPELHFLLKEDPPDLIHYQYWNTAVQLMDIMPALKEIPSVLSHHNHYALEEDDWNKFDAVIIPTTWGREKLEKDGYKHIHQVPYGIDLDRFSYIDELKPDGPTVGYIGRVVPHKNLKKIVETAEKLDVGVIGCGYVDKPDYWKTVPRYKKFKYHGGIGRNTMMSPQFKDSVYEKMSVFVMYSTGERETGTLPLFEAMARGVPVLATKQGSARDLIKDGHNGILFDEDEFEEKLRMVLNNDKLREKLRQNAWDTIKNFPEERMALEIFTVYKKVLLKDKPYISVIVPTFNRGESLIETLASIETQLYKYKEIVVIDDASDDNTKIVVNEMSKKFKTLITYIKTGEKEKYGLAHARNIGAAESHGDVLLFMDDRLGFADPDTLDKVSELNYDMDIWYYGAKKVNGKLSTKDTFVENFSWIKRKLFYQFGQFNERFEMYGGLTQETRMRAHDQGINMVRKEGIVAEELIRTKKRKKRKEIWKAKHLIRRMYE